MVAATIKDVAQYANVSLSTVSRVLNHNPTVSPELRVRVLEAAEKLGYQPDRAARRLRASPSDVVGIIISDIQNPFFVQIVRGVEDVTYAHNMSLLLCNTDEIPAKQDMYLRVMQAERVAGLIIAPANRGEGELLDQMRQAGMPIVLLDRHVDGYEFDTVMVDSFRASYQAVKYLIDAGYERIAFIGGNLHLSTGYERYQGYLEAMADAHLEVDKALVRLGDFQPETGYRLAHEVLQAARPARAIFTANNLTTRGTLQALRELGKRIPQDVALIGFDDMPWFSDINPPLTVVSQPTYEIGKEAAQLLLRRRDEPEMSIRTITLPTQLLIRQSCGAGMNRVNDDRNTTF